MVSGHGECNCLSWNPAFDEPNSLVVGCLITSSQQDFEPRNSEYELEMDAHLLQIVDVDENKLIPINGNPTLAASSEVLSETGFTAVAHSRMINDVSWAPLAGRSFHLIASSSKDRTVIIWRTVIRDIMEDVLLERPQVVAL